MLRIFIVIQLVCAAFILMTCERANMYDLAKYGLPPQTAIYIFPIHQQAGSLGGRNNADNMCYSEGFAYHTMVNAGTVKAFLSFSALDEIRFLVPVQYWFYPVIGISPSLNFTTISNTWLGLFDGSAYVTNIDIAVGLSGFTWWSGSNYDGSAVIDGTCSGWHQSDSTASGMTGLESIAAGGLWTCDISHYILCVAY